jgi:carboxypeptidase C (cathepsin A)
MGEFSQGEILVRNRSVRWIWRWSFVLAIATHLSFAQAPARDATAPAPKEEKKPAPIPPERSSVTKHDITLGGRTIHYTATAGTLLINGEENKPYGSFFYVAYTEDGVSDPKTRPVTFLYNGGPGSASIWLHMGSVGPVRVATASPEATGAPPYQTVPNEYSLLDKTDLVFVDAVGTGFSRPVGNGTEKNFAGTDQDVAAFNKFVARYITVNQRWNSPKFLFGESYGTTRSAALADSLEDDGIACNGVILMSSILNYFELAPGLDNDFVDDVPTFAAIAWHYNKVAKKPDNLKAFLKEARAFARGPYAEALAQGHNLPEEQANAIAAKLSAFTGLSVQYIKEANLKISASRYRKELLRGDREILGRYDARFEGTDFDAAGETPAYDPSSTGIAGAFVAALQDYLGRELKYSSDETYYTRGQNIIESWDWNHHVGGSRQPLHEPYVAGDLADAMRKDPHLTVFSANGLFDLATPFFKTEYDLSHMNLEPKLRQNIEFGYYPSGHMIYLNVEALKELKGDLAKFYAQATEEQQPSARGRQSAVAGK